MVVTRRTGPSNMAGDSISGQIYVWFSGRGLISRKAPCCVVVSYSSNQNSKCEAAVGRVSLSNVGASCSGVVSRCACSAISGSMSDSMNAVLFMGRVFYEKNVCQKATPNLKPAVKAVGLPLGSAMKPW